MDFSWLGLQRLLSWWDDKKKDRKEIKNAVNKLQGIATEIYRESKTPAPEEVKNCEKQLREGMGELEGKLEDFTSGKKLKKCYKNLENLREKTTLNIEKLYDPPIMNKTAKRIRIGEIKEAARNLKASL